jgi:hypothetical protein
MNLTRHMKIFIISGKLELVDKLNDSYAKYYSLTKHLAVGEIIVLFKGRVIVKHYTSKKHKNGVG